MFFEDSPDPKPLPFAGEGSNPSWSVFLRDVNLQKGWRTFGRREDWLLGTRGHTVDNSEILQQLRCIKTCK